MTNLFIHNGSNTLKGVVFRSEFFTFGGFGVPIGSQKIDENLSLKGYTVEEKNRKQVMETITRKVVREDKIVDDKASSRNASKAAKLDNLLASRGFGDAVRAEEKQKKHGYIETETIQQVSRVHGWDHYRMSVEHGEHLILVVQAQMTDGLKSAGYVIRANDGAPVRMIYLANGPYDAPIASGRFDIVPQNIVDENHAELNSCFHLSKTVGLVKFFERNDKGQEIPLAISEECGINKKIGSYSVKDYAPNRVLDFD